MDLSRCARLTHQSSTWHCENDRAAMLVQGGCLEHDLHRVRVGGMRPLPFIPRKMYRIHSVVFNPATGNSVSCPDVPEVIVINTNQLHPISTTFRGSMTSTSITDFVPKIMSCHRQLNLAPMYLGENCSSSGITLHFLSTVSHHPHWSTLSIPSFARRFSILPSGYLCDAAAAGESQWSKGRRWCVVVVWAS